MKQPRRLIRSDDQIRSMITDQEQADQVRKVLEQIKTKAD
jgi:hypothetical protein